MSPKEFEEEWGDPDSNNFAINVYHTNSHWVITIAKPRREMLEDVNVYCDRDNQIVSNYLKKSLEVVGKLLVVNPD